MFKSNFFLQLDVPERRHFLLFTEATKVQLNCKGKKISKVSFEKIISIIENFLKFTFIISTN